MTTIIAIDPGKRGGIAWNTGSGICAIPMPLTESQVVEELKSIAERASPIVGAVAYMEHVGGYIKPQTPEDEERDNRQPGHTMFRFGKGVGVIVGALLCLGIELKEVYPVTWQKIFFLKTKGKPQAERKRMLLAKARALFPALKVTLSTADALLLYHYAETVESQDLFRQREVQQ